MALQGVIVLVRILAIDAGNKRLELPDSGSTLLLGVGRAEHEPPNAGEETANDALLLLLGQPVLGLRSDSGVSH